MIVLNRVEWGVVVVINLVLIALLLPAVQHAREAARQSTSKNNLKQIAIAFSNYHNTWGCLPPGGIIREDGTAMHGWMFQIFMFMEASHLCVDFNQPWDSPENIPVYEWPMGCYQIPGVEANYSTTGFGLTHYQGNPNLLHRNSSVSLEQLEDGTAHHWLAGEVAGNYQPWGYPFNWHPLGAKLCDGPNSFGRPVWGGGHLLRADGSVTFFSDQTAPEILKAFAEAPPVATRAQTAVPDRTFDYGDFLWERIDLQSDPRADNIYVVRMLRKKWGSPILINVYTAANISPEVRATYKYQGDVLHFLLRIDASTEIADALQATTLKEESSPDQFQANLKLLRALQQELSTGREGSEP
ncbi:hypothetical protein Pan153_30070 [Gimesia panareensis]|uniref:DUF1559 domain-containing protein n=1 Tax=Gimesia panareensis TaxID=2527978 RepID=A0A518FPX2_9PLAN|nr:DUF1559 domain-containing protein [Gimesia panareensis]QDV18350.1 hypothetical protein Pan153_30070 [Gimesia panareensis]